MSAEPYWQRIPRLRAQAGVSINRLAGTTGYSAELIKRISRNPETAANHRYPSPQVIETLARELGVNPVEFPEFELAVFRDQFDERKVGLDEALATMRAYKEAVGE